MKKLFLTVLVFLIGSDILFSQIYQNRYRPPDQNWHELRTSHFRILFPGDYQSVAERSAMILEREYPHVQQRVGGELDEFLLILNMENDRSGGFVSPMPFRSEVEGAPRRGKGFNPRSGGWLEQVLPHELVHALHFNVNPKSATSVIGLFSPDIRRSVHAAAPLGLFEGIAVHYETHGTPYRAGRGNHSFFTDRSLALTTPDDRWSMGQLFHRPGSTLPADRHYIGSYQFTNWLLESYGQGTMKEAIRIHYQLPILGFGYALRRVTGQWPASLHNTFVEEQTGIEDRELFDHTSVDLLPLIKKYKGVLFRRPLWISDRQLLVHASFYTAPTGFYRYHLDTGDLELELEQRVSEDYRFILDRENSTLWFSDYIIDGRYDQLYHSDLFTYNLDTGERRRLTRRKRVSSPAPGDRLLALQTNADSRQAVSLHNDSVTVLSSLGENESVEEILQHPEQRDLVAYIVRKGALQALWIDEHKGEKPDLHRSPDLYFKDGSIFDLDWHPFSRKLLFTSDKTGSLELYEYHLDDHRLYRLTSSRTSLYEGSYSPDGTSIAFIVQMEEQSLPATASLDQLERTEIDQSNWNGTADEVRQLVQPNRLNEREAPESDDWQIHPYRTGFSWLWPRTVIPETEHYSGGFRRWGLSIQSTDPLGRHTYQLSGSHMEDRLWFDLDYKYSGFYPGFGLNMYNRPTSIFMPSGNIETGESIFILGRRRGVSLYIPFRFTLKDGPRMTQLIIRPEYRYSQLHLLRSGRAEEDFFSGQTDYLQDIRMNISFGYHLRQFRRDIQPNAGWIVNIGTDVNLWSRSDEDRPLQFQFDGQRGLNASLYRFLGPLSRWNQSLRLGVRYLNQTKFGPYNPRGLFTDAFLTDLFPGVQQLGSFNTRYTIPLLHIDNGGFLIPAYLESVYLVLMSETALRLDENRSSQYLKQSRTAFGVGLRSRARISNFSFDIGIGIGYEPTRNNWRGIIGDF